MAQNPPVICPRCGTRAEPGQRFCSECGATLNRDVNKPTELAGGASFETVPAQSGASPQTPQTPQLAPTVPVAPVSPDATVMTPDTPPASGQATPASASNGQPSFAGSPASPYSPAPVSGSQFYSETTDANVIPPPPPPDSYISLPQATPQGPQSTQSTPAPAAPSSPGTYAPVPSYAQAPKRSRGCMVVSVVLLLVLAAGAAGLYLFVIKPHLGNSGNPQLTATGAAGQQNTPVITNNTNITPTMGNTPTSVTTTPSTGSTSTTSGATNEQLNLAFVYSGINYTITSVEYAPGFSDDSSLSSGGVRISFRESNTTSRTIIFAYSEVARLILPDGTAMAPANELHYASPDAQASDTNWLDFQVANQPADLSKLVLEMGLATENQMKIPLSPSANLSQYQPRTSSPNATFSFDGLTWTLTEATMSYSANGQQATAGNIYITITLHVVNNSSQTFVEAPSNYMRLVAGGATNAPDTNATLTDFIAPQTNATGKVTFLAPQGGTTYTLVMEGQQVSPPVQTVSQNFQIP